MQSPGEFCVIWKFRVKAAGRDAFIAAYRPGGTWTELFARAKDFRSTSLIQDERDPLGFITIDRWSSRQAYDAFRAQFAEEYTTLDRAFDDLTEAEELVFSGVSS